MHILFLSHYFVPENNAPAARVHGLAKEWARLGHRVTVLTGASAQDENSSTVETARTRNRR